MGASDARRGIAAVRLRRAYRTATSFGSCQSADLWLAVPVALSWPLDEAAESVTHRPPRRGLSQTRTDPVYESVTIHAQLAASASEPADDLNVLALKLKREAQGDFRAALRGHSDRSGRLLVPALRPQLPRHRGDAPGAWPYRRSLDHQPVGARLRAGHRTPPAAVPQAACGSVRVDETYIKVRGQWRYLYRAIDKHGRGGRLPASPPTAIYDAAKQVFRKMLVAEPSLLQTGSGT